MKWQPTSIGKIIKRYSDGIVGPTKKDATEQHTFQHTLHPYTFLIFTTCNKEKIEEKNGVGGEGRVEGGGTWKMISWKWTVFFARGNYITVIVDAASVKAVLAPLLPLGAYLFIYLFAACSTS